MESSPDQEVLVLSTKQNVKLSPNLLYELVRKLELRFGIGRVFDVGEGELAMFPIDGDVIKAASSMPEVESVRLAPAETFSLPPIATLKERCAFARRSVVVSFKNLTESALVISGVELKDGLWVQFLPSRIPPQETVTLATIAKHTIIGGIEGSISLGVEGNNNGSDAPKITMQWTYLPLDSARYRYSAPAPYHISKVQSEEGPHSKASFVIILSASTSSSKANNNSDDASNAAEETTAATGGGEGEQESGKEENNREVSDSERINVGNAADDPILSQPVPETEVLAVSAAIGEQFVGDEGWKQVLIKHRRSIVVCVVNRSETSLQLVSQNLKSGRWASSPPDLLPPNSEGEFGVVDGGPLVGIDGNAEYAFPGAVSGESVQLFFRNPVLGPNAFSMNVPPMFDKDCSASHGNAAKVRYTITDNFAAANASARALAAAKSAAAAAAVTSSSTAVPSPAAAAAQVIAENEANSNNNNANDNNQSNVGGWRPLRVLSLNAALYTTAEQLGCELSTIQRAKQLGAELARVGAAYEIIALQGVGSAESGIENALLSSSPSLSKVFPHIVRADVAAAASPSSSFSETAKGSEGGIHGLGIVFLSKHQPVATFSRKFAESAGPKEEQSKGCVAAVFAIESSNRKSFCCVVACDNQSDAGEGEGWESVRDKEAKVAEVRQHQLGEVGEMIAHVKSLSEYRGENNNDHNLPLIVCGSLRVEAETAIEDEFESTLEYSAMTSVLETRSSSVLIDAYRSLHPLTEPGYTWDFTQNSLVDGSVHFVCRSSYIFALTPAEKKSEGGGGGGGGGFDVEESVDASKSKLVVWSEVVPVGDTPDTRLSSHFAIGAVLRIEM